MEMTQCDNMKMFCEIGYRGKRMWAMGTGSSGQCGEAAASEEPPASWSVILVIIKDGRNLVSQWRDTHH